MKNKYFWTLLFIFLNFTNVILANEIIFDSKDIVVLENGNRIISSEGVARSIDHALIIKADNFDYNIKEHSNIYKSKDNRFVYEIDDGIKQIIKSIISEDCKNILDDLKKYYNSNIYLGQAMITRNFHYDPSKEESYSSYFHCDGYLCTYFKILINLSDVDSNMGAINILNKKNTKNNVSLFKYNSRSYVKQKKIDSQIFVNTSPAGSSLLVSTPHCLHKAGIPKKNYHRDMLFLIFCAYPNKDKNIFYYEKEKDNPIWNAYNQSIVRKLSKPYGYKNLFKLYNNFKVKD